MAFWDKKKIRDSVERFLLDNNVSIDKADEYLSFELYLKKSEYSLFPYIKINEETSELSFLINLRQITNEIDIYKKINKFNLESKYLVAKISEDNTLFLEYNITTDISCVKDDLKIIIENVFSLQETIDNL